MTPTQQLAKVKAQEALRQIELAQVLLSKACEELCPIKGLCEEWEDVGSHYDKIKALWHRVNARVQGGGYDLDEDARRSVLGKGKL